MASYKKCESRAINNSQLLFCIFAQAVSESGATILKLSVYPFDDIAFTGTAILSESHASIHTYPEHQAVFVDLFTCGNNTDWQKFENIMCECLHPEMIDRTVTERN